MIDALRSALLVARKDLLIEWRSREVVLSTVLFAALLIVLASLSLYLSQSLGRQVAPGVLWLSIAFSGIIVVGQSWQRERASRALDALLLSPIPDASIYLGKVCSGLVFLLAVELFALPLVVLLFGLSIGALIPNLLLVLALGSLGFVAPATLFGAMRGSSEVRLSIAVFPLVSPALLAAVTATRDLFAGASFAEIEVWVRVLIAYDLGALFLGAALFTLAIRD